MACGKGSRGGSIASGGYLRLSVTRVPAGAVEQPDAEDPLEGHEVAGHGGLRDAEFDSGVSGPQ